MSVYVCVYVYFYFLPIFCASVASGTWTFFLCPLMLLRTSCLRRAQTTSPQRSPPGELLPCCPRPRSSPCSSTPLTEPTAGIRCIHKHTDYIRCHWLHVYYFYLSTAACLFTCHVSCLIIIEFSIYECVWRLLFSVSMEIMSMIYLYVSMWEMSQDPEIHCFNSVWLMRHECQQCASSNVMCHCLSQHQRAHEDRAALQFTFYDVISARPGAPAALRSLQSHCLIPGLYSTHLEKWLTYYPANQVSKGTDTHLHSTVPF